MECIMKLTGVFNSWVVGVSLFVAQGAMAAQEILNTSYDVSRELFAEINPYFQAYWRAQTGEDIKIQHSHAGSSSQAGAILQGLIADVVTFHQSTDIDVLHKKGKYVNPDWRNSF